MGNDIGGSIEGPPESRVYCGNMVPRGLRASNVDMNIMTLQNSFFGHFYLRFFFFTNDTISPRGLRFWLEFNRGG